MAFRLARWLYLLLIVSLPLVRPFNVTLFGLLVPFTDFIFAAAALAWLVALLQRQAEIKCSWFYLPLALYLAAMVCSTLASVNPQRSAIKLMGEVYLLGLAVLTINLVRSIRFMRRVMGAWLVGTAITILVSVPGIILFYAGVRSEEINYALAGYGSLPPGDYPRVRGLFANMNMLCNYLNVSLMLALVTGALGWVKTTWFWILHIGVWITAVFTVSPGIGGLILCFGLWLWVRFRETKRRRVAAIALAVSGVAALVFLAATAIAPVSSGSHTHSGLPFIGAKIEPSVRALTWQTAYSTFRDHPLLGRGVGMEVSSVAYLDPSGSHNYLTDAHNIWLSIAGQEGIVGLLAFLNIIIFLYNRLLPLRVDADPNATIRTGLGIAFIGAVLYQGLSGSFEDARHLWVLMGLIVCVSEGLREAET